jgi:hypothetical protein
MRIIEGVRLRRAARRYARLLGQRLSRDYGSGTRYTPAQIRAAAHRCGLSDAFLKIGYAAFLTEENFRHVVPAQAWSEYDLLRALFRSHAPGASSSGFEPVAENSYFSDSGMS